MISSNRTSIALLGGMAASCLAVLSMASPDVYANNSSQQRAPQYSATSSTGSEAPASLTKAYPLSTGPLNKTRAAIATTPPRKAHAARRAVPPSEASKHIPWLFWSVLGAGVLLILALFWVEIGGWQVRRSSHKPERALRLGWGRRSKPDHPPTSGNGRRPAGWTELPSRQRPHDASATVPTGTPGQKAIGAGGREATEKIDQDRPRVSAPTPPTTGSGSRLHRVGFTTEAIRLTRELRNHLPADGEVTDLLALMLLTDARRLARIRRNGALPTLAERDRSKRETRAIAEGVALITDALARTPIDSHQLRAAIAAVHSEAASPEDADWSEMLGPHDLLYGIAPAPMITLNRLVALAMVHGPQSALEQLGAPQADPALATFRRAHAVRAPGAVFRAQDAVRLVDEYDRRVIVLESALTSTHETQTDLQVPEPLSARAWRGLAATLILTGTLVVVDAGATLLWQEPISALYASLRQDHLSGALAKVERAPPTPPDRRTLLALPNQSTRIAFLARELQRRAGEGSPVARIRIPRIGASFVVVKGTSTSDLRSGPGIYPETGFPGSAGTTAIAGHRTTYLAPFRHIDALRSGNQILLNTPYAQFTYTVIGTSVVAPSDVRAAIANVGYSRLVLSACTPLFSAAKRMLVYAQLTRTVPVGPGRTAIAQVSSRAAGEAPHGAVASAGRMTRVTNG
jgi:sortase A